MNVLQKNLTELLVSPDGSTVFRDNENVYQYSNGTTGVMLYTPYSGESLSALINIQLPDGTVLPEKPMNFEGSVKENGEIFYLWSYIFSNLGTSISGYNYAVPLTIAFRFLNVPDGADKTTNEIKIPVQPSKKGAAMVVDPTTADALNAKIDQNSAKISRLKGEIGDLNNLSNQIPADGRDNLVDAINFALLNRSLVLWGVNAPTVASTLFWKKV